MRSKFNVNEIGDLLWGGVDKWGGGWKWLKSIICIDSFSRGRRKEGQRRGDGGDKE